MAVVCAAAVLSSAVVWLVPYSSHCSAGEYCCYVVHCSSPGAVVWVVWVCVCGVCVVGYPLSAPPSSWMVGGAIVDGGWHSGWWGGMMGEGRLCCWPPRRMLGFPVCMLASPSRLRGGPVEWRGVAGACCPRVRIGSSPFTLFSSLLHCLVPLTLSFLSSLPPFVFSVTACWFSAVFL